MAGFFNDVLYAENVDFTGTFPISGQINQDGELLVGSTVAPYIRAYVPTGSNGVSISAGAGTLDLSLSAVPNSALAHSTITLASGTNITVTGSPVALGGGATVNVSGPPSATTLTNHGVLVGQGTSAITATAAGSAGQVLQSAGAAANPAYSTATYPSIATGTGTILRADGTNWVATTATYPATTTVSQILYSSASNVVGGITTANNSVVLTDGSGVPSLGTTLANSFAFTASSSGGTISTTVSNTSNTASSDALQQVTVAGTSAGDAFTTYTVSGTTNWSVGTDNSATTPSVDPFVVAASTALGTTNIMAAATTGEINFPLQSAFLANEAASPTNVTGDGTVYTTLYDTEIFDQNSDFSSPTFTSPITGRYHFSCMFRMNGITSSHTLGAYTLVTSNRNYVLNNAPSKIFDTASAVVFQLIMLCDMDAADTASVTIALSNGTKVADVVGGTGSYFSGYLEC